MSDFEISKLYSTKNTTTKTINGIDSDFNPITFDVEVRRLPHNDVARFFADRGSDDEKISISAVPRVLSRAIRFDGGTVQAKPEDIAKFDSSTVDSMVAAFLEVNKVKRDDDLGNS